MSRREEQSGDTAPGPQGAQAPPATRRNDRTCAPLSLEGGLGDLALGLNNKHEKAGQEVPGSDFSLTTD